MPRFPDLGEKPWRDTLLDWLLAGHNADGSLKNHAPVFNVQDPQFAGGAKGTWNGSTGANDTAAIQAAMDAAAGKGITYLPDPINQYGVTSLAIPDNTWLCGSGHVFESVVGGSVIAGMDPAQDVFSVVRPDGSYAQNIRISHLCTTGGRRGFATYQGISYFTLEDVEFANAAGANFYMEGWIEKVDWLKVRLAGGQYGFQAAYVGNPHATPTNCYIDKATFAHVYAAGASKNNWRIELHVMDAVTWDECNLTSSGEHGMVIDAGARGLTFNQLSTEANGTSGKSNRTTGSITNGTPTLTVASAAGYAIGDSVTVKGALGYQGDLTANVLNVVGTTITLDANAAATVTNAAVTNAKWDDVHFDNAVSGGSPGQITFVGGVIGGEASTGHLRYAINAAPITAGLALLDSGVALPVYDPQRQVFVIGGTVPLRRPTAMNGWDFRGFVAPLDDVGEGTLAFYGGARGQDTIFGLPDSIGNGGGTFGKFSWRIGDPNKTEALSLDGATKKLTAIGNITAGDGVTNKYLSGAGKTTVVDADFTTTPGNGTAVVHYDTTAGKAYISVRANGAWKVMAGPI